MGRRARDSREPEEPKKSPRYGRPLSSVLLARTRAARRGAAYLSPGSIVRINRQRTKIEIYREREREETGETNERKTVHENEL